MSVSIERPVAFRSWGHARGGRFRTLGSIGLLVGSPLFVAYLWTCCRAYGCALSAPVADVAARGTLAIADLLAAAPHATLEGFAIFGGWYLLQLVLAAALPARTGFGAVTPAGHRLGYRLNGFLAWAVTHGLLYLAAFRWGLFRPTLVYDHGGGLLVAANAVGLGVALLARWKARTRPTHADDRTWSGNAWYDFFAGVELNPRVAGLDLKLFHVAHLGMMAWTVVNGSLAAAQHERLGHVTSSMLLLNVLQSLYVLDFFVREDWYLRTIDMQHDRFGFYLAWGGIVWIPFVYTLQAAYLVEHPVELSPVAVGGILTLGAAGYVMFLSANRQRDRFRRTGGRCRIWGREVRSIPATYRTADGMIHETTLLASGWWGLARHANYLGDVMMATAFSLTCAFTHLLPYSYPICLTVLLIHRVYRDDRRCRDKYGAAWDAYCAVVPYRMVPGFW
jgi:7-dehydrocholesterol reductase